MKNKILILSLMSLMMVGIVGAVSIQNVNTDYNKKDNVVQFNFEAVLQDECAPVDITILDHKDNVVGGYSSQGAICAICYGGSCHYFTATGTYSIERMLNLIPKRDIKGVGNLRYEITQTYFGQELLASGRLK